MARPTAIFVDGLGAAAATSSILSQLQGRVFALLSLQPRLIALEDIAAESRAADGDRRPGPAGEPLRRDFLRKIARNSKGSA